MKFPTQRSSHCLQPSLNNIRKTYNHHHQKFTKFYERIKKKSFFYGKMWKKLLTKKWIFFNTTSVYSQRLLLLLNESQWKHENEFVFRFFLFNETMRKNAINILIRIQEWKKTIIIMIIIIKNSKIYKYVKMLCGFKRKYPRADAKKPH